MTRYDINSVMGRRRGRHNQKLPNRSAGIRDHDDVCAAHWIVRRSGVLNMLESYRDEDFPNRRTNGGRPARVTDEQLLVAGLITGMSGTVMHDKEMAALLWEQLGPQSRELLGLPEQHTGDFENYYIAVNRAWHRMCALIDPKPNMGFQRNTREQVDAFMKQFDPELLARKRQRLHAVTNALLEATWQLVPKKVREQWDGSIGIDGTPLRVWGKRGTIKIGTDKSPDDLIHAENNAGWYHRNPDDRGTTKKATFWGYEAHLAVTFNANGLPMPRLVLGMSFDRPAVNIAGNSHTCLTSITERGHQPGTFVADLGVLPGGMDTNLHDKAKALGYKLCFDYKITELGKQGSYDGAILVEGSWYGPCMPQKLIDATIIYRQERDEAQDEDGRRKAWETYAKRIQQRAMYLVRDKAKPDADGYTVKQCPAAGSSPLAKCSLKPNEKLDGRIRKELPFVVISRRDTPAHPGKICTNSSSITMPPSAGGKYTQDYQYKTDDWSRIYADGRNASEGFNGFAKDRGQEDLESAGNRRVRGFARQCMLTALLLTCANQRKIDGLKTRNNSDAPAPQPRTRARRRTESTRDLLPDANAPPADPADPGEAA